MTGDRVQSVHERPPGMSCIIYPGLELTLDRQAWRLITVFSV